MYGTLKIWSIRYFYWMNQLVSITIAVLRAHRNNWTFLAKITLVIAGRVVDIGDSEDSGEADEVNGWRKN
jgi:hypothetical protein